MEDKTIEIRYQLLNNDVSIYKTYKETDISTKAIHAYRHGKNSVRKFNFKRTFKMLLVATKCL